MVRTRSIEKRDQIVGAALEVFLREGFRAAHVSSISEAAGVSSGTIYLYASSKEALFELALRKAFGDPLPRVVELPFNGEIGPDLVDWMWRRLNEVSPFRRLREAAGREAPVDESAEEEFLGVVTELWDWESRYWAALELLEKCAREWPELDMLFYRQFRRELLGECACYLRSRMDAGLLRPFRDAETASRVILETVTFFAMHRHVRPDSESLDEDSSKETVVTLLRRGFVPASEGP